MNTPGPGMNLPQTRRWNWLSRQSWFTRQSWWWWALVGLLSLGQLQRLQITADIAVNIHDGLLAGWAIWLAYRQRRFLVDKVAAQASRYSWQGVVVMSWVGLGWATALSQGELSALAVLFTVRLGLYLSWATLLWWTKPVSLSRLELGLVGLVGLTAWFGWLQYVLIPDTRVLAVLGWDNHLYRLIGTQFDPNFTGILLVLGWLYVSARWPAAHLPLAWRRLLLLALTGAIALTFSRASYLAFGIVLGMSFVYGLISGRGRSTKRAIITAILFVLMVVLAPKPGGEGVKLDRTSSVTARATATRRFVAGLKPHHWLIGRGLFNFGSDQASQSSDGQRSDGGQQFGSGQRSNAGQRSENSPRPDHAVFPDSLPVTLLVSLGLPGAATVSWTIVKQIWEWWPIRPVTAGSWTAVLIHSLFNNTLLQSFVLIVLLLITISEQARFEQHSSADLE